MPRRRGLPGPPTEPARVRHGEAMPRGRMATSPLRSGPVRPRWLGPRSPPSGRALGPLPQRGLDRSAACWEVGRSIRSVGRESVASFGSGGSSRSPWIARRATTRGRALRVEPRADGGVVRPPCTSRVVGSSRVRERLPAPPSPHRGPRTPSCAEGRRRCLGARAGPLPPTLAVPTCRGASFRRWERDLGLLAPQRQAPPQTTPRRPPVNPPPWRARPPPDARHGAGRPGRARGA